MLQLRTRALSLSPPESDSSRPVSIGSMVQSTSLVDEIKSIEFLPSEFAFKDSSSCEKKLLRKIYEPRVDELVSLGASTSEKFMHLTWITRPTLGKFCRDSLNKDVFASLELNAEPSTNVVIENFTKMVEQLTTSSDLLLNNLNANDFKTTCVRIVTRCVHCCARFHSFSWKSNRNARLSRRIELFERSRNTIKSRGLFTRRRANSMPTIGSCSRAWAREKKSNSSSVQRF